MNFLPSEYFDTTTFKFASVFEMGKPAWEAVNIIHSFIENFKDTPLARDFTEIQEGVFVGKNVTIEKGAVITGKAIIGDNSTLGHASFLREGVILGEGVHIGHAVEVKHSILLNNTAVAHLGYVGDSIIGGNVNIAGGVIFANLRLDRKNVVIKNGEEVTDTGMGKFSGLVGDGVSIGANVVINPGTIIGKGSIVYPLSSISGSYSADSSIKSSH